MVGFATKVAAKLREKGLAHCARAALARVAQQFRCAYYRARQFCRIAYYRTWGGAVLTYWHTRAFLLGTALKARRFLVPASHTARAGWQFLAFVVPSLLLRLAGIHVLRGAGVRFLPVLVSDLGHLAMEVDCYVKAGVLGKRPRQVGVLLAPPEVPVASPSLLDYWRRHVCVVRSPYLCRLLAPFAATGPLRYSVWDYVVTRNGTAAAPALQAEYAGRPPLLRLMEEHRARGQACLRALGVPEGAWFVCLHCREPGCAPGEWPSELRGVRVANYVPAVAALVERGGWCVRLGEPTMRRLPPMPGVLDYAHSTLRSDWMDLYLLAACAFVLGGSPGPCQVATAFGVPCAVADQAPLAAAYPHGPCDVGIPKLFWSRPQGRYLTFEELLGCRLGDERFLRGFTREGVEVVANTPEDVRDLALEMLDRVEGRASYTPEDERRQEAFRGLFRPGHYAYGSHARIGRDFLRKHQALIFRPAQPLAA